MKTKAAEVAEVSTHPKGGRARSRESAALSPPWVRKADALHRGQAYWRTGEKPHTRRDGTETTLTEWRSYCAECGEPFTFFAPSSTAAKLQPNRRCSEHARPGRSPRKSK